MITTTNPWLQSISGTFRLWKLENLPTQSFAPEVFKTKCLVQVIFSYLHLSQLRSAHIEAASKEANLWQDFTWQDYFQSAEEEKSSRIISYMPEVLSYHYDFCLENLVYLVTEGASFCLLGKPSFASDIRDIALDWVPDLSIQVPIIKDQAPQAIKEGSFESFSLMHCALKEVRRNQMSCENLLPFNPWLQSISGSLRLWKLENLPTQSFAPEVFKTQCIVRVIFSYLDLSQLRSGHIKAASKEVNLWQDFTWQDYFQSAEVEKKSRIIFYMPGLLSFHFNYCLENLVYLMTEGASFCLLGKPSFAKNIRDIALDWVPDLSMRVPIINDEAPEEVMEASFESLSLMHCAVKETSHSQMPCEDLLPFLEVCETEVAFETLQYKAEKNLMRSYSMLDDAISYCHYPLTIMLLKYDKKKSFTIEDENIHFWEIFKTHHGDEAASWEGVKKPLTD